MGKRHRLVYSPKMRELGWGRPWWRSVRIIKEYGLRRYCR